MSYPLTDTNPAKSHDEKRILSSELAGRDHLNTNTLHATNCKIENQREGEGGEEYWERY